MKTQFSFLCIFYLLFVIYGSLVPLDYRVLPLDQAWTSFKNIRFLNLGIESRADWVANILLFIPLSFLGLGRLSLNASRSSRVISSVLVFFACIVLCLSIEFTQLFFPPRTVSQNDIIAETLGSFIGITAWWFWGGRFIGWFESIYLKSSDPTFYLKIYLAGLFFYNVMPLDLTLSVVELFHKWREGRIIILPFYGLKGDLFKDAYEIVSDMILWIPVPRLWIQKTYLSRIQLLTNLFIAASVIELFQLFVYSRVTDVTDILMAVIGGGIGILWFSNANNTPSKHLGVAREILAVLGFILWCIVIFGVFWYPYNFNFNARLEGIQERFLKIPFYSYYYGSEFRALTEVFHKVLLFFPLGVLSKVIIKSSKNPLFEFIALFFIACIALIVEVGQFWLPNKHADITDWLLEVFGAYLGMLLVDKLGRDFISQPKITLEESTVRVQTTHNLSQFEQESRKRLAQSFLASVLFVLISGILWFLSSQAAVPYNFRELFSENYPILSALGITTLLYWCFSYPAHILISQYYSNNSSGFFLFKAVIIHALVAWVLVRAIIPLESIHDIVGYPVLSIFPEVEMAVRFIVLFSAFSAILIGGAFFSSVFYLEKKRFRKLITGGLELVLLLPVVFWIVIVEAGTDNLTELMPNFGYSFRVLNILFYMLLFSLLGSLIAASVMSKKTMYLVKVFLLLLVSFPIGYQLLTLGTEQLIFKYNSVFSAMQFLLSSDRDNLLSEDELRNRFFILHSALIFLVMLTQWTVLVFYRFPNRLKTFY